MKKYIPFILIGLFAFPAIALADICSDIAGSYNQRILQLARDTEMAIKLSDDPDEIAAIRMSYEIQKAQLEAERDSALVSSGCTVIDDPNPVPDPDPEPNPDDGTGGDGDDGTGGDGDDGTGGDGDDGTGGDGDDGSRKDDNDGSNDDTIVLGCHEQLEAHAEILKTQGLTANQLVASIRAKAKELRCNFGLWNASKRVPDHLAGKHRSRRLGGNSGTVSPQSRRRGRR